MKKMIAGLALLTLSASAAFAADASVFQCDGTGFSNAVFALKPNSGVLPLAMVGDKLVSVKLTSDGTNETLQILVQTKGEAQIESAQGSAKGNVTYVKGSFFVTCNPKM